MLKLDSKDYKNILECIKFDVLSTQSKFLKEDAELLMYQTDPNVMLHTFFEDIELLKEEFLLEENIFAIFKKIVSGFISLVKSLAPIAAFFGLKSLFTTAENSILGGYKAGLVLAKKFAMIGSKVGGTVAKLKGKGIIGQTWAKLTTGTKAGVSGAKIGTVIGKSYTAFASVAKPLLLNVGVSSATASAIMPIAAAVITVAGALIVLKICKMIVAGIKKMFAGFKSDKEKAKEANEKTGESLAKASINMQKQAISKIDNPEARKKAEAQLKKKMSYLKAA